MNKQWHPDRHGPDEDPNTPSNAQQALWAEQALETFKFVMDDMHLKDCSDEDQQDALQDLISNLGHYADSRGWDFDELVRRGLDNHAEER